MPATGDAGAILTPPTEHLSTPSTPTRSPSRAPSTRRQETKDSDKAGRVWARTEEDDPWAPCILTLDGGGIRGYSSLMILKALMHEVWLWECELDKEEDGGSRRESEQAKSGDEGDNSASRGRSPLSNEVYSEPEEVEQKHGVSPPDASISDAVPAVEHVQQDERTADVTIRKALSEEELLPCHYFDFMYGTSTGGLIATILGRLRMTVTEALELYRKVGDDLFGKRRSSVPLMTKYRHEPLEKAVREIVGARCHEHENCDGNDMHPWDSHRMEEILKLPVRFDVDNPRVCQSCCLTATHDNNVTEAYLLRSYPHYYSEATPNFVTRYNEGADLLSIWQVTRATSAAPFYFEMLRAEVEGVEKAFKDGGIRENNPSGAALSEFHALYEGRVKKPALMLSVGTGIPNQESDGFANSWSGILGRLPGMNKFLEKRAVIQNVLIKYTEGEKQHHFMRQHAEGENTWYKRLNVNEGLGTMPLDEWVNGQWHGEKNVRGGETLTKMEDVTRRYLEREFDAAVDSYAPPYMMVRQAAEKLVRQRRARERLGGERWDAFVAKNLHQRREQGLDMGEGQANGEAG